MVELVKVPLKTRRPNGLKNARGRNGYFQADSAWIDPILEEVDEETNNPIIGLEIWSRQIGDAAPIIVRLRIEEWRILFKAIEDAYSEMSLEEGGNGKGESIDSWSILMATDKGKQITLAPDDIPVSLSEDIDRLIEHDLKYPVTWRNYEEDKAQNEQ